MKIEFNSIDEFVDLANLVIGHPSEGLLQKLLEQGKLLMATQAELTVQLNATTDTLKKVQTETTGLLSKIDELLAIINGGTVPVSAELKAAADALQAQATVVDDLVPDAPAP